ncbi:MAG TPA: ABC transporter ATP-binding protein [Pirellulaceae bacterium]|jgi:ABC-2 type transport system ATP-binding protein|nr:ABC transporter ATP-binding protein [Pirellulaceae bacterium]
MSSSAAIEVNNLKKSYRNGLFGKPFVALKGVSFRVARGEIFGLLGPNGAGKTTLIKTVLGIIRRNGGEATLLGKPAGDRESRLRVGYLPENLRLSSHHTALTALEYYGRLSGLSAADVKANRMQLLESVGLNGHERESIKKFSKGMVQRLGLAQALLHDPELLILDEPTDGLDPVGRSHVRNVLHRLKNEGKTIFLNSHILQEVELVCDRVAILDKGELRALGTVAEIAPQKADGIEVELMVSGDKETVRRALGDRGVTHWRTEGRNHQILLPIPDQAAVDQCVDDMRRNQVSVIQLNPRRITLEDAFLKLLDQSPTPESPAPEVAVDAVEIIEDVVAIDEG